MSLRILAIEPYDGPDDGAGLVQVHDLTAVPYGIYAVGAGAVVSNSKRMALGDVNALLAHGAFPVISDASLIRGQANPDLWARFMAGHPMPTPKTPYVWQKFLAELQAGGINVAGKGPKLRFMGMTGRDVDQMSEGRSLENAETVKPDEDFTPVKGGLFDPRLTGGHNERGRWSKIDLAEAVPNPVMEEPVRRILGLTNPQFRKIISGEEELGGKTGLGAISHALSQVNVTEQLAEARSTIEHSRGQKRDAAARRLRYLKSAERLGMHPKDWLWSAAPVLPPAFRPVGALGQTGITVSADANGLYRDLWDANENLKTINQKVGPQHAGRERLAMYDALTAVTGLGDPVTAKSQDRRLTGVLRHVIGGNAKFSTMQRKLLSSAVDNVGRAVIVPNADLDMDHIGLPEDRAYEIYSRYLMRRLRRRGLGSSEALHHLDQKTPLAKASLEQEMEERPVVINRAPVLHKFGILAFRPKLVDGDAVHMPPLVVKGFGADFDGDAVQFHAPASAESVRSAYETMLPSKNLISPADFKSPVHMPTNEFVAGLYAATHRPPDEKKKHERVFATKEDMLQALRKGEINMDDPVAILRH